MPPTFPPLPGVGRSSSYFPHALASSLSALILEPSLWPRKTGRRKLDIMLACQVKTGHIKSGYGKINAYGNRTRYRSATGLRRGAKLPKSWFGTKTSQVQILSLRPFPGSGVLTDLP